MSDRVFAMAGEVQTYQLPFAFGAKVHIDGHRDIRATVIGFAIYPHNAEIQVAWFANGDAKTAWVGVDRLTALE